MGKKHASQYANFGWLHTSILIKLAIMVQQGTACRYPALLMVYLYFPFTIKSL